MLICWEIEHGGYYRLNIKVFAGKGDYFLLEMIELIRDTIFIANFLKHFSWIDIVNRNISSGDKRYIFSNSAIISRLHLRRTKFYKSLFVLLFMVSWPSLFVITNVLFFYCEYWIKRFEKKIEKKNRKETILIHIHPIYILISR